MSTNSKKGQELIEENAELRARLEEAEETLLALRRGDVDAVVVGEHLYILESSAAASSRFRGEVLSHITEAVIAVDNDGHVIYVNGAAEKLYGVAADDVLGLTSDRIFTVKWQSGESRSDAEKALKLSSFWRGENTHVRNDGSEFWAESTVSERRGADGDIVGTLTVVRDITERKQAETEIRTRDERYRNFIKSSSEGIWRFELDEPIPTGLSTDEQIEKAYQFGYLAECNDVMARQYGYETADQVVGARLADMFADDPNNVDFLRAFIESGYELTDAESHEKTRDGADVFFLNSLVGFVEDGKLVRAWGTQRDVTERKQVEEAKAHLASIVKSSDDAIVSKDTRGYIKSWNIGAERIFGYTAEEAIGKHVTLLIPPDRHFEENDILARILDGKSVDHYETIRRRKDGTDFNVSLTISPIYSESGQIIGASKIARDITESKQIEESLSQNQVMLSLAMSSSHMGVWERDIATGTIWWSEELEAIFGLRAGEFRGTDEHYYELMFDADREATRAEVERAIKEHREYSIEFRFHHTDGSTRWMEGRGQAFYSESGEPVRLYGIGIDVTRRKETEDVQQKYRLLSEQARDIIWLLRQDGGIIEANRTACETYGFSRDELLRMNIRDLRDPSTLEDLPGQLASAVETGMHFETLHRRKDGTVFPVEVNANSAEFGDERFVMSIVRDITERKRSEEAIRKSEEKYRTLFDSIDEGYCIVEVLFDRDEKPVDYRFLTMNPAFERQSGLKNAAGKLMRDIAPAHEEFWFEIYGHIAKTGKPSRFEHRAAALERYFDVYAYRIGEPEENKVAILFNDISERKKTEENLRLAKEFDDAVMGNMGEGLYTVDADGLVTSMNPAAEKLFGWTLDELRGCRMHDATHYKHRDGRPFPAEECAGFRVLTTGETVTNHEDSFIRKDGTFFDVMYTSSPIREEGKITGLVVVFADITERQQEAKNRQFLFEISEFVRQCENPGDLLYSVSQATGKYLNANRCLFNEIDLENDREIVHGDYADGVESVSGVHKISQYSSATTQEMIDGKTVVNCDSGIDARTAADYQRVYKPAGERSYVAVPLLRNGKWVASLWVSRTEAKEWTAQEVSLLESVAERTWLAVEKLRSESALRDSEEQYRTLFDLVPVAVYTCDADGVIQAFNQNAAKLWGREPEADEKYCGSFKIYFPDGRPMPHGLCPMARVLKGENVPAEESEILVERADGARKIVIAQPKVLKDAAGTITGAINCLYDITDLKVAQQALIRAERQAASEYHDLLARIVPLGQTLGSSRDLISVYRAVLDFVRSSMSCSGFFVSFYEQETSMRTAAYVWGEGEEIDTSLLPPMHITPEGGSNSQAILNKQTVVTNRYWDTMKNRPHVVLQENGIDPMSSLVVPMMVKNQVVGTLEVQAHEDGSFTPEHSIALEMAANLAAVAIDNVRLLETEARAREEAESANRMKDDFLSVLSHELRTPLNSILGWVRMLNKGGLTADQTSKALEVIERNTRIQSSLIEDLLDVSRIISNKMRIEKELTDLSTIAHTASEAIRPLAAAKNIEFRVETNREPLFTDGDPVRLQQLVSNLLQNAVKFTPVGGTIELTLERSDSEAVMRISDTGIGIENEMLPHIFERFRQGDASTKRGFTGLGLGLTIVRTIAELHGGDIAVESGGAGKGSTFTVRLPLAELFYASNGSRAKAAGDGPNGKTLSGIRILLVDDDADSLRPLQLFLQQHDADVSTAGSAESALDALGSKPFDVLITDIGMPVTDGFGLVTRMRDSAGLVNAGLPAIAVTAYASTEDRERAAAAGFQAHLAKPVDYDELLAAVNDLCRNDKAGAGL